MSDASTFVVSVVVVSALLALFGLAAGALAFKDVVRRRVMMRPPRGCSFCRRKREKVEKLIAGPGVAICGECAGAFMAEGVAGPADGLFADPSTRVARCSFCDRVAEPLFTKSPWTICRACVHVCRQILEDDARGASVSEGAAQQ